MGQVRPEVGAPSPTTSAFASALTLAAAAACLPAPRKAIILNARVSNKLPKQRFCGQLGQSPGSIFIVARRFKYRHLTRKSWETHISGPSVTRVSWSISRVSWSISAPKRPNSARSPSLEPSSLACRGSRVGVPLSACKSRGSIFESNPFTFLPCERSPYECAAAISGPRSKFSGLSLPAPFCTP